MACSLSQVSHAGGRSGERRVFLGGLAGPYLVLPCAPSPPEDPRKFMNFIEQEKLEESVLSCSVFWRLHLFYLYIK